MGKQQDHVAEAIALMDKSAERTRPNAQTQAWATIRAHIEGLEARVRELEADAAKWRNYVNYRSDAEPSHVCRKCGHRYTPEAGESEDCPNCGHDGTDMQASREGR